MTAQFRPVPYRAYRAPYYPTPGNPGFARSRGILFGPEQSVPRNTLSGLSFAIRGLLVVCLNGRAQNQVELQRQEFEHQPPPSKRVEQVDTWKLVSTNDV